MIGLADVEAAYARIRDAVYYSPCPASEALGDLTGTRCHVKLEESILGYRLVVGSGIR